MGKKKQLSYEDLKKIWYAKLAKKKDSLYPDGFKDIEKDEDNLKEWSTAFTKKKSLDSWQAKQTYYNMADSFLHDHVFATRLDQIIWEYHANGISVRDIADTLNKVRRKKTNRTTVWLAVKRLEAIMLKMYNIIGPTND